MRTLGATNYSKEQVNFIKANWQNMSDETLSKKTNIPVSSIQRCRTRNGLLRYKYSLKDNTTLAYVCELYTSQLPMKEIARIVGKSHNTISRIISKNLFGKPLSELTKVITLISKI